MYRFTKLANILEHLKIPHNMDKFENRLKIQKAIYLLQELGLDMNYKFSWYLYGPYSTDLASEAFAIDPIFEDLIDNKSLSGQELKILSKMEALLHELNLASDELSRDFSDILELASSIVFLIMKSHVPDDLNEIVSKITILKPKYTKRDVELIYNLLKRIGVY